MRPSPPFLSFSCGCSCTTTTYSLNVITGYNCLHEQMPHGHCFGQDKIKIKWSQSQNTHNDWLLLSLTTGHIWLWCYLKLTTVLQSKTETEAWQLQAIDPDIWRQFWILTFIFSIVLCGPMWVVDFLRLKKYTNLLIRLQNLQPVSTRNEKQFNVKSFLCHISYVTLSFVTDGTVAAVIVEWAGERMNELNKTVKKTHETFFSDHFGAFGL